MRWSEIQERDSLLVQWYYHITKHVLIHLLLLDSKPGCIRPVCIFHAFLFLLLSYLKHFALGCYWEYIEHCWQGCKVVSSLGHKSKSVKDLAASVFISALCLADTVWGSRCSKWPVLFLVVSWQRPGRNSPSSLGLWVSIIALRFTAKGTVHMFNRNGSVKI